jgi:hypothetical protein
MPKPDAWAIALVAALLLPDPGSPTGGVRYAPAYADPASVVGPETFPARDSSQEPGASLTVYLMTIGQGDAIWERFGHNAIWIQDERTGRGVAYNWGMFDFGQVDFIPRLMRGTMLYWMAPRDPEASLQESRWTNRPAWIQELALTPEQKAELQAYVEWNALPENSHYRYDYYRDNCSSRVRDALDRVLGGRLKQVASQRTTDHTYRWHTRRLLRDMPAAYLGIQFVLGPDADEPLTGWEEAFLPIRLMDEIRNVEVPDGEGGVRSLVVQERELVPSSRPPEPSDVPFAFPLFLLVGLLWGGAVLVLSRKGVNQGFLARLSLLALAGGWALLASIGGTVLLAAWLFTDHVFWYKNLNLLQVNPFFLPLAVAYLLVLFPGSFPRWARDLAVALGVLAGVGLLLGIIPGIGQTNGEILAFTVPVNGALVVGSSWLWDSSGTRPALSRTDVSEVRSEPGPG